MTPLSRTAASAAVALAAFALFTLEPFVGKVLLPRMGGTPMVWNTCVMVFQALLLAGYLYSVCCRAIHRRGGCISGSASRPY